MEDYNKIIESLGIKFIKSKNLRVLTPAYITDFYDVENRLLLINKGDFYFGPDQSKISEGDMLFIPGGKSTPITYGDKGAKKITNEEYVSNKERYFASNKDSKTIGSIENSFTYITFDAKVFDTVNFFSSLDIPPFTITNNKMVADLLMELVKMQFGQEPGRERVIKLNTERIGIEIIRYVIKNNLFVEQLATNVTYFKDPRLIDIFSYIRDNINGDLSNQQLANVANVSEDYVGQYFKMLTGINPQDYIEYQRMEAAVNLLRTSKFSIREIGKMTGYKDTAYFCRRFKMMFGIPAGKMRRRESTISL
ncbi:MAG: AraC family transcriptional regulator [Bacteroidetes bacterium]|nr:MAG: AraC family transcriptional regulator [Bacteroidota bacterium]